VLTRAAAFAADVAVLLPGVAVAAAILLTAVVVVVVVVWLLSKLSAERIIMMV
jgi:hypothetical protein